MPVKADSLGNAASHTLQWKGFSPVWILTGMSEKNVFHTYYNEKIFSSISCKIEGMGGYLRKGCFTWWLYSSVGVDEDHDSRSSGWSLDVGPERTREADSSPGGGQAWVGAVLEVAAAQALCTRRREERPLSSVNSKIVAWLVGLSGKRLLDILQSKSLSPVWVARCLDSWPLGAKVVSHIL